MTQGHVVTLKDDLYHNTGGPSQEDEIVYYEEIKRELIRRLKYECRSR
jgi:hypothetical protein